MCNYTARRHKILKGNKYEASTSYIVEKDGHRCQYISFSLFRLKYASVIVNKMEENGLRKGNSQFFIRDGIPILARDVPAVLE